MTHFQEQLFGIPLSTHRNRSVELGEFPYESIIASISIIFFRTTIPALSCCQEPATLRWFFGILLGFLAYTNRSYELIAAVEIFSYAVPVCLYADWPLSPWKTVIRPQYSNFLRLVLIAFSAALSLVASHVIATGEFWQCILWFVPTPIVETVAAFFPIQEVQAAYDILDHFVTEPGLLMYQICRLLFVTFHIQCGIGYLGIDFLKEEQHRRNQLVRMDVTTDNEDQVHGQATSEIKSTATSHKTQKGSKSNGVSSAPDKDETSTSARTERRLQKSRQFQRTAGPFILYTAVPYMIKIIAYGNLNAFAFSCFKDDIHRTVRLYDLFEHESHLVAIAEHSATSPEGKINEGKHLRNSASAANKSKLCHLLWP